MSLRFAIVGGFIFLSGCSYHVAEQTDRMVADMARKSFDQQPPQQPAKLSDGPDKPKDKESPQVVNDLETVGFLQAQPPAQPAAPRANAPPKLEVPSELPGSEVPKITAKTQAEIKELATKLYPALPPLPEEPKPVLRPEGPYTLAELQTIAANNSPALKQAASDVKAAEGALVQARTYANPTLGYSFQPSNDGSTAGVHGLLVDQKINTAGKMALAVKAAQQDLKNAELALKRARSDLATQVRTAYFGLLVAKETARVNRSLAVLTDEVYGTQAKLLLGGQAAPHEPANLRGQAYTARLALQQSITNYDFAWKQVVAAIGLRQLPLSEVAGRIDAFIPYFDYDVVRNHVLTHHTDILTARNGIEKARYNLKQQQVTPFSDVDFQMFVGKETSLAPFQWYAQGQVAITLPIWDQNKGNIMSAEAALVRAAEQPHASELTITNNLQNAYNNYKNALDGLEFYRRYILPDQVRYYRGVLDRRQIDPNAQFGDLVQAQQTLASNVSSYLTILGQIWTSAVAVADFLQTDDLFQLAKPEAVPALQDMTELAPLPCCHPNLAGPATGSCQLPDATLPPVGTNWSPINATKP
jgi:outer membrane protein, heavy metal efflux system